MKGIFKKVKQEEVPITSTLSEIASTQAQQESQFTFNFFEEKDNSSNPADQQQKKKKKKKKKASTNPSNPTILDEKEEDDEELKPVASANLKPTEDINNSTIDSRIEQQLINSLQATSLNQPPPPPTPQSVESSQQSKEPSQASKKKKKNTSSKKNKSKAKSDAKESDDDIMKFLDGIIESQKEETLKQQKLKPSSSNNQSKLKSKNTKPTDSTKGPKFITANSADVAKLDEQEKLKLKYGKGKNLVSVGPKKVRDPNWLGPPPGLTKVSDADLRVIRPPEQAQPSSKANNSNTDVVYHHSPFTFSFTGL